MNDRVPYIFPCNSFLGRDEYYSWGLNRIAKVVSFSNNDCKLVHGNVCLASVVATPTLDWKLHAFNVQSKFDDEMGMQLDQCCSGASPSLIELLKMGSWLSTEEFSVKYSTVMSWRLLQHIDQYGESLSAQVVDEQCTQVYPHVAYGISDTFASLRELTLKSMLVLAPKLSQHSISGSLLKYLSKLQVYMIYLLIQLELV
ncbi:hypothetical protein SADUNF_Sadunf13G0072000 [Salix dunnii]|uniref:ARM repeat superfamily protein n=1 Tax=Salix dunnii TaxID=1413687 RepID=A0A835JIS4_9ROSI|nr:hypothetical protein SADUNF_Sadunf13G0072000 [Salix dunnii]